MVKKLITQDTRMFLTGNEVIAYAANAAQAEFMYGYPITPQNEIMHTWCKLLPKTEAGSASSSPATEILELMLLIPLSMSAPFFRSDFFILISDFSFMFFCNVSSKVSFGNDVSATF